MSGIADEEEYFDQVIEAKRQNYRFIRVFLHRDRIGRGQKEILISGCVGLHAYKTGMDGIGGTSEYEFKTIHGDEMRFTFDKNEREYVCDLLDDQGPGYFSEVGFNRDLIASHFSEPYFIIKDVEVLKDIKKRYETLIALGGEKIERKKAPVLNNNSTSEDIDEQIKFLQNMKKTLKGEESVEVKIPVSKDETQEITTLSPEEIAEEKKKEANEKRVAKQREKRKLEREAKLKEKETIGV